MPKTDIKLEDYIIGRKKPRIYAFTSKSVPGYLKIGDTHRDVSTRISEWENIYGKGNVRLVKDWSAEIPNTNSYFRDYSIHKYLESKKKRLDEKTFPDVYYSNEFFKNTTKQDVSKAIESIIKSYKNSEMIYNFLDLNSHQIVQQVYPRSDKEWNLREPLQTEAVEKFKNAIDNNHKNLLMYAVMRFGKSFTALSCAEKMEANIVLVVSAKAEVKDEWKQNVEIPRQFVNWIFIDSKALKSNKNVITEFRERNKKVVIFLTLQDLKDIDKPKFDELKNQKIDLMIIDETHFGARAETLGRIIKTARYKKDTALYKEENKAIDEKSTTEIDVSDAKKIIDKANESLNVNVKLHLSGTPYRILMGGEFGKEDIISFCQYSDICNEKENWDKKKVLKDENEEWDNPYFGFPKMIRFAFNMNKSAFERMRQLEQDGYSYKLSALFEPKSVEKDKNNEYREFIYKKEILDFLKTIGGTKKDDNILDILNNEKIKEGKLCRHIVMVLPYRASCDALHKLIKKNISKLGVLKEYKIINVAGIDSPYHNIDEVKNKIYEIENDKKPKAKTKTITLTVNKMLTGCTVPEWDTMIYLKDTVSPQDYDQAIFRLQSPYIATYEENNEKKQMKRDLKPQTLLIDFEPQRMYYLQAEKSKIYNINTDNKGSENIEERIKNDLEISPIISLNANKLVEVEPVDIIRAVNEFSINRSVNDEAVEMAVDMNLFNDELIKKVIDSENEINSTKGISGEVYTGEESDYTEEDINLLAENEGILKEQKQTENSNTEITDGSVYINKFKSYYRRILFYAFLTKSLDIRNLKSLIDSIDSTADNQRLAKNLGLSKKFLIYYRKVVNQFVLLDIDDRIFKIHRLSHDYDKYKNKSPIKRAKIAIKNFGKLGESEVVTPSEFADKIVNTISNENLKMSFNKESKGILDIASKMGEFAISIVERAEKLGISKEKYKNKIYSICTSKIAYEFTRWIYEALGLNVQNIAEKFLTYDLLDIKEADYNKTVRILTQDGQFNKIYLNSKIKKEENKIMKFNAIVGNPPYQKETKNTSDEQIYNHFMDLSYMLSDEAVLITPAKFLRNAGKTPEAWNKKMLNDKHLKVVYYEIDSNKVFPEASINGGIVITYHNNNKEFEPITFFGTSDEIVTIKDKVVNDESFESIKDMVYLQNKFNLEKLNKDYPNIYDKIGSKGKEKRILSSAFEKLEEIFSMDKGSSKVKIYGNCKKQKRIYRYINKKYLDNYGNLDKYKIIMSATDGASGIIGRPVPARIVGKQLPAIPGEGYTQTFISIGNFDNKDECSNLSKYLFSKFARFMLGTLKATNGLKQNVWVNLPKQNFKNHTDAEVKKDKSLIDWSKSIKELDDKANKKYDCNSINQIDAQLYKKYKLSKEEVQYIEKMIASVYE